MTRRSTVGSSRDPWSPTCNWEQKNQDWECLSLGDKIWIPSRVWATDATREEKSLKPQKSEERGFQMGSFQNIMRIKDLKIYTPTRVKLSSLKAIQAEIERRHDFKNWLVVLSLFQIHISLCYCIHKTNSVKNSTSFSYWQQMTYLRKVIFRYFRHHIS